MDSCNGKSSSECRDLLQDVLDSEYSDAFPDVLIFDDVDLPLDVVLASVRVASAIGRAVARCGVVSKIFIRFISGSTSLITLPFKTFYSIFPVTELKESMEPVVDCLKQRMSRSCGKVTRTPSEVKRMLQQAANDWLSSLNAM